MAPVKKRPIHQYPENALQNALKAIREEQMTIRQASRTFGVPRGTLQDRLHGRVKEGPRRMGPSTVLTENEEIKLVNWITELAKCGFPRKKCDLLNTVQQIILKQERKTPFNEGRPGEKWYRSFLKRHPELSFREAEGLTTSRSIITEESLRKWFRELEDYLKENNVSDILEHPDRIFNGDETSFSMCPKTGKVLAPKGWKNLYDIKKGNEKETITVLLVFSASGKTVYPMVVFPYVRPPKAVIDSIPSEWYLGKSETGWMRSDVFYEYVANGFNKWLEKENVTKPVLLLIDGHKSHLTMELSEFCGNNGIILYALPPNTTHIMQPADVSVFKGLKSEWKKTVRSWQSKPENVNSVLTKTTFCPLLKEVLENNSLPNSIVNGFRKTGLYPFNPDAVDYTKCVKNHIENLNKALTIPCDISKAEFEITEKVLFKLQNQLEKKNIENVDNIIREIQAVKHEMYNPDNEFETYEITEDGFLEKIGTNIEETTELNLEQNQPYIPEEKIEEVLNQESNYYYLSWDNMDQDVQDFETNNKDSLSESEQEDSLHLKNKSSNESCDNNDNTTIIPNLEVKIDNISKPEPDLIDLRHEEEVINENCDDNVATNQVVEPAKVDITDSDKTLSSITDSQKVPDNNSKNINILQNIKLNEDTSFNSHLFWPSPTLNEKTKKKLGDKPPAAISSESFRNYLKQKQDKKKKMEEDKIKRKEDRRKRTQEKNIEKQSKKKKKASMLQIQDELSCTTEFKKKEKCHTCDEQLESDVEDDELKNVGCDLCPRWFHLKCTKFAGCQYEQIAQKDFQCDFC